MNSAWFRALRFLLVFQENLVSLVNQLLFTFYVFEHIVGFWYCHVVRKHLRILLIKFEDSREALTCFSDRVKSFKIFREIIENEVLFEDRNYMTLLVVHDIRGNLRVVIFLRGQVSAVQCFLNHQAQIVVFLDFQSYCIDRCHRPVQCPT